MFCFFLRFFFIFRDFGHFSAVMHDSSNALIPILIQGFLSQLYFAHLDESRNITIYTDSD